MAVFRVTARLSVAAVTGPMADLDPQLEAKFVMKEQEAVKGVVLTWKY